MERPTRRLLTLSLSSLLGLVGGMIGAVGTSGCAYDCVPCAQGEVGIYCKVGLQRQELCGASQFLAEVQCGEAGGFPVAAQTCDTYASGESGDMGGETGDGETGDGSQPWDPGAAIAFDRARDARVIDAGFVETLRANPNILRLDSTRLVEQADSGYYEVSAAGELADALGWQQGDLVLAVNGHDLQGLDAVLDAYIALESTQRLTLELERAGSLVTLAYVIE